MVRVDPERILKDGLAMWVTIESVREDGISEIAPVRVGAIIDTGSECSGISEKVAKAFTDAARGIREIWSPTLGLRTEPTLRCKLTYDNDAKTDVTAVSLIRELGPYDVLIGRDLLMNTKLVVDFSKGEWLLSPLGPNSSSE